MADPLTQPDLKKLREVAEKAIPERVREVLAYADKWNAPDDNFIGSTHLRYGDLRSLLDLLASLEGENERLRKAQIKVRNFLREHDPSPVALIGLANILDRALSPLAQPHQGGEDPKPPNQDATP